MMMPYSDVIEAAIEEEETMLTRPSDDPLEENLQTFKDDFVNSNPYENIASYQELPDSSKDSCNVSKKSRKIKKKE